ncbi:MAG: MurR/RpiR family transcriptional regulator [Gammaproteobacteria bacterium]|nr:MAG: MurR/RpiR family transcriptional regulator [Gammaproteobacteria bacterium]
MNDRQASGDGMNNDPSSDPGSNLEQRVLGTYDAMSPSERRLADTLIACRGDLARYSATELAQEAQVSKATAARFFQKLGYKSFREARRQALRSRPWGSPLEALAELTEPLQGRGNLGRHLANDVSNLTRTAEAIDPGEIERAVEMLTNARRILVVGFRNSHSLADYAFMVLNSIKPDVRFLGSGGLSSPEQVAGLGAEDVILAIGFRRRPHLLREILETAGHRQVPSVLLTDGTASRTKELASVTLTCRNHGMYLFDSYVSSISIVNFLCSAVALALGHRAWTRLAEIEDLHGTFGDLVQPRTGSREQ